MIRKKNTAERGSALVYILIAIALLAALTVSFMEPSSQQTQSQNTFNLTSELAAQADFIRSTVQECVVLYPGGDAGTLPPNPLVQHNQPFPIDPRNAYLTNPVVGGDPLVRDIRCPGKPGDNPDHQPLFSGRSGKFMPPPPPMFGQWQWYNGPDGVFFWIVSNNTDAFINSALTKLEEQFGTCEADFVQTSALSFDLDNAGEATCPSNSYCFRVWMITDNEIVADAETSVFSPAKSALCP
jgi:hypothetical protein